MLRTLFLSSLVCGVTPIALAERSPIDFEVEAETVLVITPLSDDTETREAETFLGEASLNGTAETVLENGVRLRGRFALRLQKDHPQRPGGSGGFGTNVNAVPGAFSSLSDGPVPNGEGDDLRARLETAYFQIDGGYGELRLGKDSGVAARFHEGAPDVLRHARDAEAAGAQGVLLAPVSYLPLTDDDVAGLVADVAGATGLPICIYNNPGTTHFTISEALLARLAQIAGVAAVKNPPPSDRGFGAQIARVRASTPAGFSVGYSGDAAIAGALQGGADAWYSVLAGTCPDLCLGLWQAREDAVALKALNSRLAPLWALFDAHGSIRVVYEIANILGLGPVTLPKPLLPMPTPVRDQIAAALDSVMGVTA